MNMKNINLSSAMLQRGRQAAAATAQIMPTAEMPMVLTLDQVRPNPDNPRTSRNPRYDDIKASIQARGLDTVPKVTRDPEGEEVYIFSDGGNTRYQILCELWQETGEERFFRFPVMFKPWPGRLQCVIGHLAENEVRGELSFIEKALGIQKARAIYEEQLSKTVTLRELSTLLTEGGLPVHNSSISRMDDAVKYLYPWIPDLLISGLGRPQILSLLGLREDGESTWNQYFYTAEPEPTLSFMEVFGACCAKFNSPELWAIDLFRDELIGDLLMAMPHPALNYDRWQLELDPKERQRRKTMDDNAPLPPLQPVHPADGEYEPPAVEPSLLDGQISNGVGITSAPSLASVTPASPGLQRSSTLSGTGSALDPEDDEGHDELGDFGQVSTASGTVTAHPTTSFTPISPGTEVQPDLYGAPPVLSGHVPVLSAASAPSVVVSPLTFAEVGLEPVTDIWAITPLHDDIDHLQAMAFRLVFELAEVTGCNGYIEEARNLQRAGYTHAEGYDDMPAFAAFLLSLAEPTLISVDFSLTDILTGTAQSAPQLDDVHTVKLLRLVRVLRRLRELQRQLTLDTDKENDK